MTQCFNSPSNPCACMAYDDCLPPNLRRAVISADFPASGRDQKIKAGARVLSEQFGVIGSGPAAEEIAAAVFDAMNKA